MLIVKHCILLLKNHKVIDADGFFYTLYKLSTVIPFQSLKKNV